MDNDDELEAIRRRKIQEMQRNAADEQMAAEQQKAAEVEKARRQQILRQILSPEARERLSRVRLVRADMAENVENQLIQLAGAGRINRVISDEELRDILEKLSGAKKETKIEWRYK
ncbi:MAG: DNA-binding protein [Thermoplasmata archaeon]